MDFDRQVLADHLLHRREDILAAWQSAIKQDDSLRTGKSLPRAQLMDHIPALLASFDAKLRAIASSVGEAPTTTPVALAAAHGLQRWQQGYDLREVTREISRLNECVVAELDRFVEDDGQISMPALASARRLWASLCSTSIEESVGQYYQLQQKEAAGQVRDLEHALGDLRGLERERAELWRQAAHDLRGNLGVVANATVGLARDGLRESSRDDFVRILMRNVTTLHQLLDDVTSLARLQAGRELRQIEPIDVTPIIAQLCEGILPLAQQRRLFLRCEGPAGFAAHGDAVKIRRIAQNLILNAVKFTQEGGVSVSWGDSGADDRKRWELCISDTGPGFHQSAGANIGQVVEGEGIGLSIVKRLCELLDATLEMESTEQVGTTFRVFFPREYPPGT